MAQINSANPEDLYKIKRLIMHHDHLKALKASYDYMWKRETLAKMRDKKTVFAIDLADLKKQEESYFTSLIIRLDFDQNSFLFDQVYKAYTEIATLIKDFYPNTKPEINTKHAHITIKSIVDFKKQKEGELNLYKRIISPTIEKWLNLMSKDTRLFAKGLFTNLHRGKGLSIGIKFYPSTSMLQMIRGELGVALYNGVDQKLLSPDLLRPEEQFHTMLIHSTGFQLKNFNSPFPLHEKFILKFEQSIQKYEDRVFGNISDLSMEDFFLRNGYSNKLIIGPEKGIEIACKKKNKIIP